MQPKSYSCWQHNLEIQASPYNNFNWKVDARNRAGQDTLKPLHNHLLAWVTELSYSVGWSIEVCKKTVSILVFTKEFNGKETNNQS